MKSHKTKLEKLQETLRFLNTLGNFMSMSIDFIQFV